MLWCAAIVAAPLLVACSDDDNDMITLPDDSGIQNGADSIQTDAEWAVDSVDLWCRRDTNNIYGVMYYNATTSEPQPAVVLSHSSSLTHASMKGYAAQIARMGYAAYCFDFCGGSDESKSDGAMDSMTVFTEVEDLRAVVRTVKGMPYVDPSRVYLLGSSQGGLVSALLADECPDDFAGMVLFYPAFNIPEMVQMFSNLGSMGNIGNWGDLSGMMTMSEAYINSIKDYDVWAHVGTFPKPVCIIHGTKDIVVPIANSEKAAALYPAATLHKIEGANHGFNNANLGSMGAMMGASADYDAQVMPIVEAFLKK